MSSRIKYIASVLLPVYIICAYLIFSVVIGKYQSIGFNDSNTISDVSRDSISTSEAIISLSESLISSSENLSSETPISSDPVSSSVEPTPVPAANYVYSNGAKLNLRSGPSSDYSIIIQLPHATKLKVLSVEDEWLHVILEDMTDGYVFAELTVPVKPDPLPTPSDAPALRTLEKWPAVFTLSGLYDANLQQYLGRSNSEDSKPLEGITVILDPGHGGVDSGAVYEGASPLYEKSVNIAVANLIKEKLEKMGAIVILTRENDKYVSLHARSGIINRFILSEHKRILEANGDDVTDVNRLIGLMESVIAANSDYDTYAARGIMQGLGTDIDLRRIMDISAEHKDIMLISIHCNSIYGASYVNGIEVYYGTNSVIYNDSKSMLNEEPKNNPLNPSYMCYDDQNRKKLATLIRDKLQACTDFKLGKNSGLIANNFHMIRENNLINSLVEMGYISNSSDRNYVSSPQGQQEIAVAIAEAVYSFYCIP